MREELELETTLSAKAAGCNGCGRVFTCVSAFDRHQRITADGLVCLDPLTVGLDRQRSGRYAWKAAATQPPQFGVRVASVAEKSAPLVSLPRGG